MITNAIISLYHSLTIYAVRWILFFSLCGLYTANAQSPFPDIEKDKDGSIIRTQDLLGNQIPDFSYSGYQASVKPIPTVTVKAFVPHFNGDATATVQEAIDHVSGLPIDDNGFRGAVLLDQGIFQIAGELQLEANGVVLRGSGTGPDGTILRGTGIKREAIITISGTDDRVYKDTIEMSAKYTPLGSMALTLTSANTLKKGDHILINTPITQGWIDSLGMNEFGGETGWLGWKEDDFVIKTDREVVAIEGNTVTVDAPLTNALNSQLSNSVVIPFTWSGRISNIGIENLSLESDFDATNDKDEQHRWYGVSMQNVTNAWVRQVNFKYFSGGAVAILRGSKKVTVEDCMATDPVSEIAAFRRNTFYTEGQQTLFQRCYSEYGYHDFAVGGYATPGPNVFLQCESYRPYSYSGSLGSWNTGILFDMTHIDGHALSFANKGQDSRGLGWNAANSVIWESAASRIENFSPPTAQNWAFGVWGQFAGNGHWKEVNNHISPRSLFYALREKRIGLEPIDPQLLGTASKPSTSPTLEQAAALTGLAVKDMVSLKEWIDSAAYRNPVSTAYSKAKRISRVEMEKMIKAKTPDIRIDMGRLSGEGGLITGEMNQVSWWRGSLRDTDLSGASPHITRFVPGHYGLGYTDNLRETVEFMGDHNVAAIDHNYGLWYERRMDDHERVRRFDADVWTPFYEQPFNRSGQGLAWDHLSKYDLTDYNDWYWYRLNEFAQLAGDRDKVLINEQYFQHNILEAGAHWSSSPWRSVNNINHTGFPEPPPYAGDKRIFMSKQFYDVSNGHRKELHAAFIRKNLENFKDNPNVLQLISAEFTGPLHFVEFWIDVIKDYEASHPNASKITLSTTKDVQDAILKDASRADVIDVIDIKYWYYKHDGSVYAPEGGKFLAPRQHARQMDSGKETEEQVYRAVREYRKKYPKKAVIYSTPRANQFGWAVLMAGGSLPAIPKINIPGFSKDLLQMKPASDNQYNSSFWSIENPGISYLFYLKDVEEVVLDLSDYRGKFNIYWLDTKTGTVISEKGVSGKRILNLTTPSENENAGIAFIKKI